MSPLALGPAPGFPVPVAILSLLIAIRVPRSYYAHSRGFCGPRSVCRSRAPQSGLVPLDFELGEQEDAERAVVLSAAAVASVPASPGILWGGGPGGDHLPDDLCPGERAGPAGCAPGEAAGTKSSASV
jgi:hypothetical protein